MQCRSRIQSRLQPRRIDTHLGGGIAIYLLSFRRIPIPGQYKMVSTPLQTNNIATSHFLTKWSDTCQGKQKQKCNFLAKTKSPFEHLFAQKCGCHRPAGITSHQQISNTVLFSWNQKHIGIRVYPTIQSSNGKQISQKWWNIALNNSKVIKVADGNLSTQALLRRKTATEKPDTWIVISKEAVCYQVVQSAITRSGCNFRDDSVRFSQSGNAASVWVFTSYPQHGGDFFQLANSRDAE